VIDRRNRDAKQIAEKLRQVFDSFNINGKSSTKSGNSPFVIFAARNF